MKSNSSDPTRRGSLALKYIDAIPGEGRRADHYWAADTSHVRSARGRSGKNQQRAIPYLSIS